jgi:hypothetical protein
VRYEYGEEFGIDFTGTTMRVTGRASGQMTERFPTFEEPFHLPTGAVEGMNLGEGEVRQRGEVKCPTGADGLAGTERTLFAFRPLTQALNPLLVERFSKALGDQIHG